MEVHETFGEKVLLHYRRLLFSHRSRRDIHDGCDENAVGGEALLFSFVPARWARRLLLCLQTDRSLLSTVEHPERST